MDLNFLKFFGFNKRNKCSELQPPNEYKAEDMLGYKKVFLAGSIEMGKAEDWQREIVNSLSHLKFLFFNPRRKDWDSTWEQTIENENFYGQVMWELDHLDDSDIIVLYLQPDTISPVSLIEFGLHARGGKLIVYCPDGYFKKGNIDITCEKYSIPVANNWSEVTNYLISKLD